MGNMTRERRAENTSLHSSFDHPHILAGQGSLGLEILDQVPDVDAIVVPTGKNMTRKREELLCSNLLLLPDCSGGGGLLAGVGE